MAFNVTRSRAKSLKGQVEGLKELERKIKELQADHPEFARQAQLVVATSANRVADLMRTKATGAGWASQKTTSKGEVVTGQQAIDSIFSYGQAKPSRSGRAKITALAGVSKSKSMVEWIAGRNPKSPRAKVPPGSPVAMSLAAMLEFGTTNRAARPAIRPAVTESRGPVIDEVTTGFRKILTDVAKS